MPKYTFAFVSGALVIVLSLSSFVVPPEQASWLRWRLGAIIVGILALVALGVQLYLQYREEKNMRAEDEKRNQERDKKIDEILRRMPKRGRTVDAAPGTGMGLLLQQETLTDRVGNLAHEYYACLQKGVPLSVYESRLKPKLLELLPELQKATIKANISQDDIEPTKDRFTIAMRRTADKLAMAAIKMTYPKTKIAGHFLVLDEDDDDTS